MRDMCRACGKEVDWENPSHNCSPSFEYHLNMFHTLVDQLRVNYGTEDDKKLFYYLDNRGQEALFAAQASLRQSDSDIKLDKQNLIDLFAKRLLEYAYKENGVTEILKARKVTEIANQLKSEL